MISLLWRIFHHQSQAMQLSNLALLSVFTALAASHPLSHSATLSTSTSMEPFTSPMQTAIPFADEKRKRMDIADEPSGDFEDEINRYFQRMKDQYLSQKQDRTFVGGPPQTPPPPPPASRPGESESKYKAIAAEIIQSVQDSERKSPLRPSDFRAKSSKESFAPSFPAQSSPESDMKAGGRVLSSIFHQNEKANTVPSPLKSILKPSKESSSRTPLKSILKSSKATSLGVGAPIGPSSSKPLAGVSS